MADFVSMWSTIAPVDLVEEPAPEVTVEPARQTDDEPEPEPESEPEIDVEALVTQAHKDGIEKGRKQAEAALAPIRAELEAERKQLATLARELLAARQRELDGVRNEVADLVLLMARRVVGDAMAIHPDALRNVVLGAISRVPGTDPVKVKVSPDDVERVSGWLSDMPRFQVEAADGLEGGCVVESRYGSVEATVENAFSALEAATRAWVDEG